MNDELRKLNRNRVQKLRDCEKCGTRFELSVHESWDNTAPYKGQQCPDCKAVTQKKIDRIHELIREREEIRRETGL